MSPQVGSWDVSNMSSTCRGSGTVTQDKGNWASRVSHEALSLAALLGNRLLVQGDIREDESFFDVWCDGEALQGWHMQRHQIWIIGFRARASREGFRGSFGEPWETCGCALAHRFPPSPSSRRRGQGRRGARITQRATMYWRVLSLPPLQSAQMAV